MHLHVLYIKVLMKREIMFCAKSSHKVCEEKMHLRVKSWEGTGLLLFHALLPYTILVTRMTEDATFVYIDLHFAGLFPGDGNL